MTRAKDSQNSDCRLPLREGSPAYGAKGCFLVITGLLCLAFSGCGRQRDVPSAYAQERMTKSINGLEVFTDMLQKHGCSIKNYSRLSPSLKTQDVLVWFPDDFGQPRDEALWFLEDWLSRAANRTVIFVGRDYDAGAEYWSKVIKQTPPNEREIAARRLADARQRVDLARTNAGKTYVTPWFRFENSNKTIQVTSAQGPWAQGVDFTKANLATDSKLVPPSAKVSEGTLYDPEKHNPNQSIFDVEEDEEETSSQPATAPGGTAATVTPIKTRQVDNPYRLGRKLIDDGSASPFAYEVLCNRLPGSRIFVIQNGRFLLNYGLINSEHQKIAAHLLTEITPNAKVAILHSDSSGPRVFWGQVTREKSKPDEVINTTLVLLQVALPLLCLLFVLLPIFGRAKDFPRTQISDFGKHIEAIGSLLQKGGDERYAWSRVFAYQQQFRRDSGKRHGSPLTQTAGRQIVVQINAAAFGPGRGAELGTGQWLESNIVSRNIGKVASKASQPLCLEIHIAVADPDFARTAVEALLREARLHDQSTIFIR